MNEKILKDIECLKKNLENAEGYKCIEDTKIPNAIGVKYTIKATGFEVDKGQVDYDIDKSKLVKRSYNDTTTLATVFYGIVYLIIEFFDSIKINLKDNTFKFVTYNRACDKTEITGSSEYDIGANSYKFTTEDGNILTGKFNNRTFILTINGSIYEMVDLNE